MGWGFFGLKLGDRSTNREGIFILQQREIVASLVLSVYPLKLNYTKQLTIQHRRKTTVISLHEFKNHSWPFRALSR